MPQEREPRAIRLREIALLQGAGCAPRRDAFAPPKHQRTEDVTVEDILKAHPRPLIADLAMLVDCIDECADCAAVCIVCADACLAEDDVRALIRCIRLCLDCADACIAAGRIASRQTDPHSDTQRTALEACLVACRASAAECERHAAHHEHCRLCAEECRRCEMACDALLAALSAA